MLIETVRLNWADRGAIMIRVGCCGFQMAQDEYFSTFNSIEIHKTFYQPPRPNTAERWRDRAPDDFVFTLKAWQVITHYPSSPTYRRTKLDEQDKQRCGGFQVNDVVLGGWERTRRIADILGAPVVVFQCPASLDPSQQHRQNMREFFGEIERGGLILGWEPRGEWEPQLIIELCEELDLLHVVDPFKDEQVAGSINYFRLHGRDGYYYEYTDEDLRELCDFLTREEAFCMFNNVSMADDARRFARLLSA